MDKALIQKLLDTITKVVNAEGAYADKKKEILAEATSDDETNLEEFVSWFEEMEEEDEDEDEEEDEDDAEQDDEDDSSKKS